MDIAITWLEDDRPKMTVRFPANRSITLGRDVTADMVLHRKEVSRFHARIFLRDGALVIEDLASSDGTWVNGTQVDDNRALKSADRVRLGKVDLEITIRDRAPEDFQDSTLMRPLVRCPRPGCIGIAPENAARCPECNAAMA